MDKLLAAYAKAYDFKVETRRDAEGVTYVIKGTLNESKLPEKFRGLKLMPVDGKKPSEGLRGLGYNV